MCTSVVHVLKLIFLRLSVVVVVALFAEAVFEVHPGNRQFELLVGGGGEPTIRKNIDINWGLVVDMTREDHVLVVEVSLSKVSKCSTCSDA